jgi:hypothetical protein
MNALIYFWKKYITGEIKPYSYNRYIKSGRYAPASETRYGRGIRRAETRWIGRKYEN